MKSIHNYYWVIVACIIGGGIFFSKVLFLIGETYPLLPKASPTIRGICKILWYVQSVLGIIFLSIWIFKPFSEHTLGDLVYLATGVIFVAVGVSLLIMSARY